MATLLPLTRPELDRAQIRKKGLYEFVKRAWHVVETCEFTDGRHIEQMCVHLEAVSRGKIKELVINVPPGFSKSLIVSVFWPAWHWAEIMGGAKWMHLSFDLTLSLRDATRCKELISSDWYQERFGHQAKGNKRPPVSLAGFATDLPKSKSRRAKLQEAASIFWTNLKGLRFSTMVRGKGLGWHCHIQVCDDPTKPDDIKAGGETARLALERTRQTWAGTFASRKADPKNFARVVIMQRLHADDLAATCIAAGYVHLCLPMEYDPSRHCTTPFGGDWRTVEGELLCPARADAASVAADKIRMGSVVYQAQMQQNPAPEGGSILHRKWFAGRWRAIPAGATWWQSWDATFKGTAKSDYVVGQVWARARGKFYLVDQIRERMGFVETCQAMLDFSSKWPEASRVLVEDKANGPAIMDVLAFRVPGLIPVEPRGSKEARAHAISPLCEAGNVLLPESAPWVDELLEELCRFPLAAHDDQVDAFTQGLDHASAENNYLDNLSAAMSVIQGRG